MHRAEPVTPELLARWPLPEPSDGDGKADRGTVLVVGGADSTPGAVVLAGLAALRVGAGKLKAATVEAVAVAVSTAVPEARVVGLAAAGNGTLSASSAEQVGELAARAHAVLVGPGLLGTDETAALLSALLPRLPEVPVVLDAVALGALAQDPSVAEPVRGRLVLTPNIGEAARLLGGRELEPTEATVAVARRYGAAVACHGSVADAQGRAWRDDAGNAGLGTSGSGDVLAGAVAGLLARRAEPAQAAVFAQHAHAAAGDRLAARVGALGFLARELLDELPRVLDDARG